MSVEALEISLAHHGVLFLDEQEFDRKVLEVMREPIESGKITVSLAANQAKFPSQFQLVAAMNPCPCGCLGQVRCRCTQEQVQCYRAKISDPLLDRIDMLLEVPPVVKSCCGYRLAKRRRKAPNESGNAPLKPMRRCNINNLRYFPPCVIRIFNLSNKLSAASVYRRGLITGF